MRIVAEARSVAEQSFKVTPIVVGREACSEYARSSKLEWLETNGTGGFAMGTVSGANTRRYHGLLVASLHPPVDRYVMLAKLDEAVLVAGSDTNTAIALGTNQYPDAVYPEGHRHLASFRIDPFPIWLFEVGDALIEKRVFLVQGEQTVVIQYRSTRRARLRVAPFLAFRDYHSLGRANDALDGVVRTEASSRLGTSTLCVRPYPGLPEMRIHHSEGRFETDGAWHYATEYLEELDRGLDFREDLYRIGTLELDLEPDTDAFIVATLEPRPFDAAAVRDLEHAERERRRAPVDDPLLARLGAAADQFIVRRADGSPTAIAGYPWFTDWGRDTMIALPGLLLARGHIEDAREVVRGFVGHADRGIIPNRFPDRGDTPEYNTVDATLWMFQAVAAYLEAGGDPGFLRDEFWPAATRILEWHERGTHHGIKVDPSDGLLVAGGPDTQLTWMDARVDGRVITPRHGKPVEINALYYNALRLMERWGHVLGDEAAAQSYARRADVVEAAFAKAFWNSARKCLYDVITPEGPDARVRPNQIFAVSLRFPLLTAEQRRDVVRTVERELLTRVGLRTLAPGESGYVAHYRGGPAARDGAYHQGVVWPWLLGPFVRAYLAAFGRSRENVAYCRSLFTGLELHLSEACLGTVSEIFEAEEPHRPVGAPAQAWSVAELLHTLAVDLRTSTYEV